MNKTEKKKWRRQTGYIDKATWKAGNLKKNLKSLKVLQESPIINSDGEIGAIDGICWLLSSRIGIHVATLVMTAFGRHSLGRMNHSSLIELARALYSDRNEDYIKGLEKKCQEEGLKPQSE